MDILVPEHHVEFHALELLPDYSLYHAMLTSIIKMFLVIKQSHSLTDPSFSKELSSAPQHQDYPVTIRITWQ